MLFDCYDRSAGTGSAVWWALRPASPAVCRDGRVATRNGHRPGNCLCCVHAMGQGGAHEAGRRCAGVAAQATLMVDAVIVRAMLAVLWIGGGGSEFAGLLKMCDW